MNIASSIQEIISHVDEGFTFAHLDFDLRMKCEIESLENICHIFLIRNLRSSLISQMRFVEKRISANTGVMHKDDPDPTSFVQFMRSSAKNFVANATRQFGWVTEPSVSVFRFEELSENRGSSVKRLFSVCDVPPQYNPEVIHAQTLGAETRTFSGRVTRWQDYWSQEAEELFANIGAKDINEALGYEHEITEDEWQIKPI